MLLFFQLTRSIDPVNRHVRWSQLDIFLWRAQRAKDKIEGLGSHFDCEILVYWVFVRSSSLPEVLEALKTALTGFPDSLAPAHTTLPGPVRLLTGNNLVNELGFFSNSIEVVTVFLLTSCNQLMVIPCLGCSPAAQLYEHASVCPHTCRVDRHRGAGHRLYVPGGWAGGKRRRRPRLYIAPANFDDAQAELISVQEL